MDRSINCISRAASICAVLWAGSSLWAQDPAGPAQPSVAKATVEHRALANQIIEQLEKGDWIERAAAIEACVDQDLPQAVIPLQKIVNNGMLQPWLRGRAMIAVVRLSADDVLKSFMHLADDPDPVLRAALVEAAGFAKAQAGEPLINRLLEDQHPAVRYQALSSLAQVLGEKAWPRVDALTSKLPNDASATVRRLALRSLAFVATRDAMARFDQMAAEVGLAHAVRSLQDVRDPRLIPSLLKLIVRTEVDSREFAMLMTSLQHLPRGDVIAGMKRAIAQGDQTMIHSLAQVNTALMWAIELGAPLQEAVQSMEDESTIRVVLGTLGDRRMNPSAYAGLFRQHLEYASPQIRIQAMRCLAHCPDVDLYDALKASVAGDDDSVVEAALLILMDAPTDRAPRGRLVEYLEKPLSHDAPATNPRQRSIRDLALALLGKAGDKTDYAPAFALLRDRLRSIDPQRRMSAAVALGQIAPDGAIPQIAAMQGYVTHWMVLGTFLNDRENTGFNRPLPPEEEIDFAKKYAAKYVWAIEGHAKGELEREINWTKGAVEATDGKLVVPLFVPPPATLVVGYAVADFDVEAGQDAVLDIDGDDGFRVWLNGEKVAEKVAPYKGNSACVAEQSDIKIKLKQGANRLVIKTINIDRDWWIRLRITDTNGRPLEAAPR